jgi:hypothetical protein
MSKVKLALGAAAGIYAGAHFLFGNSENAKRNAKKLQGFAIKMKGEVIEKLEKVKEISEPIYNKIVDDVSSKYKKIEAGQLDEVVADLKKQGKKILKDIKTEVGELQVVATKKVNEIANKVANKTVAKKTETKTVVKASTKKAVVSKKPEVKTATKTIVNKNTKSKTVVKTAKGKLGNVNLDAVSAVTTANPAPGVTEMSVEEVVVVTSGNATN